MMVFSNYVNETRDFINFNFVYLRLLLKKSFFKLNLASGLVRWQ